MKRLLSLGLLLMLMVSWATPVFAQEGHVRPGQVIVGSDLRLEAGDVIDGDAFLFGGSLRMADGSRIEGDVVVFGGSGKINGEIEGDVAFIGGTVDLGPTAKIDGDVASVGGQVKVDEEAYVRGQVIETTRFDFGQLDFGRIPVPPTRPVPPGPYFDRGLGFEPLDQFFRIMLGFIQGLMAALVISAIGLLVVLFLPDQTRTVGQTIRGTAPASFGIGLLTLVVGLTVMILLLITICLAPVGLLLALGLVLATLYGWIVVGYLLGQRMLQSLQKGGAEPTPVASALVGIFTVTLVQQVLMVLGRIPCLGFFFWILGAGLWLLVAATGLGAVVLTRLGTQPYNGTSLARTPPHLPAPPPPPAPPEPPAEIAPEPGDEPTESRPEAEDESSDLADKA